MENMNAGFVAEGLTSRKRAIDRYVKTKGTANDRKALKILKDLGALSPLEEKDPMAVWQASDDLLGKLGSLVGAVDGRITQPQASPLALYAMALCALEPRLMQYDYDLGWDCLLEALDHGCDPARALYADMALREPLSPEDADVRNALLGDVVKAFDAMNENRHEASDEDLLLVMGRRFALCDPGDEKLTDLVQRGLTVLARAGHVDAVRLLALSHAPEPSAWTLLARDQIANQARAGHAHAMLVMGQHLARRFSFWLPEDDGEKNLEAARDLLEKCARNNDPWAALTLAYTYLSWDDSEVEPEERNEERDKLRKDDNRALNMLETLAHERNFAPAKAMLGAWHCVMNRDVETAWPLLHDACVQKFSRQCEAACADFLVAVIISGLYVRGGRTADAPLLADFDDDKRWRIWTRERLAEITRHVRFGLIFLAVFRLKLTDGVGVDVGVRPLDDPEKRGLTDALPAIVYGGRLAIHFLLLRLAEEDSPTTQTLLAYLKARIQADMADGNEDCILADMLFTKRLFDASPCTATELEDKLLPHVPASDIAITALNILHIHAIFEDEENGSGLDVERLICETALLRHEYMKAGQNIDLPVLCTLPVLCKYAKSHFSPHVVRKTLEYVTLHLFNRKERDLKGLVAELNRIPYLCDFDMNRLWENLGLVPNIDFAPRPGQAGYETSAMRSRRSAEARKKARHKKDRHKLARRGKR